MANRKYPWNDPRFKDICENAKSSDEFARKTTELIHIWKKEGKVAADVPDNVVFNAASAHRWRTFQKEQGERRKRSNGFERLSETERESFVGDVTGGLTNRQLAEKYPELGGEKNVGQIINRVLGGRGALKEKAEKMVKKSPDEVFAEKMWGRIKTLIQKHRRVRNQQVSTLRQEKKAKTLARGLLKKRVEEGMLVEFTDEDNVTWYVLNEEGFYEPEELYKLVPEKEQQRILSHITDKPITASRLAHLLYGGEERGVAFLETFLNHYVKLSLIRFKKKDEGWSLTERVVELGVDAQSVKTLKATALENEVFAKKEAADDAPKSRAEVKKLLREDMASKMVSVTDLTDELKGKDLKLLMIGEVLYGSQ